MHELHELKTKLMNILKDYASQDMSTGSLDVIDKLTHTIKNLCKIMDEGDYQGSYRDSFRGSYRNRDSMGRYARAEDDMDSMITELRKMVNDLPPEKSKEVQRFIQKIEQM